MGSSHRSRVIVGALCATLVVGIGVDAFAARGLKQTSATGTVPEYDTRRIVAKCKAPTKAIAGGFDAEFDLDPVSFTFVTASVRNGSRKWRSTGLGAGGPQNLTSYAVCAHEKLASKSKRIEIPDSGEASGEVKAKCPKGTSAVSGGFDNPGARFVDGEVDNQIVQTTESRRAGKRKWLVSGLNIGDLDATLKAKVNCVDGAKLTTGTNVDTATASGEAEARSVVAQCKRSNQRVVSGGFDTDFPADDIVVVNGSHRDGKRSWVTEVLLGFDSSATITTYAYCEKS